ncbi:MAG: transcription-repair coupling factor [Kistimonas sp.]|nr:transcription-repair coupling factor [Kistimonas sp.]
MSPIANRLPAAPADKRIWGQASGAASACAIADIARQHPGLSLVIASDTEQAENWHRELSFFLASSHPEQGPSSPELLQFPDWETLPYDPFSPHRDLVSERLRTLHRLPSVTQAVLIVPVSTLLHRLCPRSWLQGNSLVLARGDRLNWQEWKHQLEAAGYSRVSTVMAHGEYAPRGSLLDIFPMGSRQPWRIDLLDDEIDSLRTFDPETQRTVEQHERVYLLPANEFPLSPAACDHFRKAWKATFDNDPRLCPLYQDIGKGMASPGLEYFLDLFFERTETLFDYLPAQTLLVTSSALSTRVQQFLAEAHRRYENARHNPERPLLPPARVFLEENAFGQHLKAHPQISLTEEVQPHKAGRENIGCQPLPELTVIARSENPLSRLQAFLADLPPDHRVLLTAESPGRRESLLELLGRANIHPAPVTSWQAFVQGEQPLAITTAPLDAPLWLQQPPLILITETQLLGGQVMQRRRRKQSTHQVENLLRNLEELKKGAAVVHLDHGIGLYRGLVTLQVDGQMQEFLQLEYANEAALYVPVASLNLISHYSSTGDAPVQLNRLGTDHWNKIKRKAAEKARDSAAELLDIYARRKACAGFACPPPGPDYQAFCAGFPFETTPDQQSAIDAVVQDMTSPHPMDRLVCGDVGFGKTEVALRAAFLAAHGGRQVALLVPTTLLAQQHYETFRDRFAEWPVTVDVMSRFRSATQLAAMREKLAEGKIDILIGTHKLLQPGMRFAQLGLVIIDEEHRFGVRHKDRLKALRAQADILTMTATPIPRTLNMSLSGFRDLSIIATPPARRLCVKTFIHAFDNNLIREAVCRELGRGGQVYYLHNEVRSIDKAARDLETLVPEARIAVAHGQMRERELESVMQDFYHKRFNLLVCTTIIETGIDIPSANTIIINRADALGLAQLHQLRGRVGRSHHQAWAWLLTPAGARLNTDARQRLAAIEKSQDLGSGFTLATHDMEIRGVGELLGEGQSGQIQTVGFSLFMDMLEHAARDIKAGLSPDPERSLTPGLTINLHTAALIPEDFVPDARMRLVFYKRIASTSSSEQLRELQIEMIDRFGLLPDPLKRLFRQTELRQRAEQIGVERLDIGPNGGRIDFSDSTHIDPGKVITLVQKQPGQLKLAGPCSLKLLTGTPSIERRFQTADQLLANLA